MSDKELNSYRFTSGHEPSDEMLRHIMTEVTHDVVARHKAATERYESEMDRRRTVLKAKWTDRINAAING